MSIRTEKVASVIKKALAQPVSDIAYELAAGLVTITAVRLSKDLHIAKIYVSLFGGKVGPGEFIDELDNRKQELRMYVAHNVRLKFAPELRFYLDDTLDQIDHIQRLLRNIEQDPTKNTNNPEDLSAQ
jgi:ribosome-binding factor A